METLRKVIKTGENLENQKIHVHLHRDHKNKSINRSIWNNKNKKIMRKDWKPRFKCTFKVLIINNQYEINTMWFAATTREAAKKQARKYLKETYENGFEILSMSY